MQAAKKNKIFLTRTNVRVYIHSFRIFAKRAISLVLSTVSFIKKFSVTIELLGSVKAFAD